MMSTMQKLLLIVNSGVASKALHIAKEAGAVGGTIFLGQGTSSNKWLKLLGLDDIRKEVMFVLAPRDIANRTAKELVDKLHLEKPAHGILALQNVTKWYGSRGLSQTEATEEEKVDYNYVMITVIVDRGMSQEVMEAATQAGARGGTIVHGRGSATKEIPNVFNVPIMPEKDIIIMLMTQEGSDAIIEAIQSKIDINTPGKGLIFTQPVEAVYGMSEALNNQETKKE